METNDVKVKELLRKGLPSAIQDACHLMAEDPIFRGALTSLSEIPSAYLSVSVWTELAGKKQGEDVGVFWGRSFYPGESFWAEDRAGVDTQAHINPPVFRRVAIEICQKLFDSYWWHGDWEKEDEDLELIGLVGYMDSEKGIKRAKILLWLWEIQSRDPLGNDLSATRWLEFQLGIFARLGMSLGGISLPRAIPLVELDASEMDHSLPSFIADGEEILNISAIETCAWFSGLREDSKKAIRTAELLYQVYELQKPSVPIDLSSIVLQYCKALEIEVDEFYTRYNAEIHRFVDDLKRWVNQLERWRWLSDVIEAVDARRDKQRKMEAKHFFKFIYNLGAGVDLPSEAKNGFLGRTQVELAVKARLTLSLLDSCFHRRNIHSHTGVLGSDLENVVTEIDRSRRDAQAVLALLARLKGEV